MTAEVDCSLENETCRKLISLGYGRSKKVRLYGEEMQLISDPFPAEDGIAVEAVGSSQTETRRVKLPLSVLQVASSTRVA
jgi:hypothetical protein